MRTRRTGGWRFAVAAFAVARVAAAEVVTPARLDAIVQRREAAHWPLELAPGASPGPARGLGARIGQAVLRAGPWLAAFPRDDLRFDAALMLAAIGRTFDSDALRAAFAHARAVADHDTDNPQRRFWVGGFRSPRADTAAWPVPDAGGVRVNPNRVIAEALHCDRNGLRAETIRYACGPMRDAGGYHSTHALWALDLARRQGCLAAAASAACLPALQAELSAAQPATLTPAHALEVDLFAERLLMLVVSGYTAQPLDGQVRTLLALQAPDGAWGPSAADVPYQRYHATAVSLWALASWYHRAASERTPVALPSAAR